MSNKNAPVGLGRGIFARWLLHAATAALVAAAFATLAGRFGGIAWPFELMSHFAVQLLAAQLLAMAMVTGLGRRRLALTFLPFALVNFLLIAPYALFPSWRAEAAGGPTRLKVMTANIHFSHHRAASLSAPVPMSSFSSSRPPIITARLRHCGRPTRT
jgi:hypothetical protein